MTASLAPPETRTLYAVIGVLLLLVGFAAGYITGTETARTKAPAPPMMAAGATTVNEHEGHDHPQDPALGPAVMSSHGKKRGHTFTGNVDVPPHGEEGHTKAQAVIADLQCPCGGCEHMTVASCGCDTAKEIEGLAAHLFERGKTPEEVMAQVRTHYGIAEAPSAPGIGGAIPPDVAGFLHGSKGSVNRPSNIPSSARPQN